MVRQLIPATTHSSFPALEVAAEETRRTADMEIRAGNGDVERHIGRAHVFVGGSRIRSPTAEANTSSLADEFMQLSDYENAEDTEWTDIFLSPVADQERRQAVTMGSGVEVADYLCHQHHNLVAIKVSKGKDDTDFDEYEAEDLEHSVNHNDHYAGSDDSELNFKDTDSESLDLEAKSECESVEEENPRLSRYDAWQIQMKMTQKSGDTSRDVFESTPTREEDEKYIRRGGPLAQLLRLANEGDSAAEPNARMVSQGSIGTESFTVPKRAVRVAHVEKTSPFPRPVRAPSEPRPVLLSDIQSAGGPDISETTEVRVIPPSTPTENAHSVRRDSYSLPRQQKPSSDAGPRLDESVLLQVLENSIRFTNNLLSSGKDKRALQRSQEISRLMDSVLTANVHFLNEIDGKRSLSDLIDRSAWRG